MLLFFLRRIGFAKLSRPRWEFGSVWVNKCGAHTKRYIKSATAALVAYFILLSALAKSVCVFMRVYVCLCHAYVKKGKRQRTISCYTDKRLRHPTVTRSAPENAFKKISSLGDTWKIWKAKWLFLKIFISKYIF